MKKRNWKILVVHGPNLNLLGERETSIYGKTTLAALNRRVASAARKLGAETRFFQSNSEGALIDFLHANRRRAHGIVINPAAYTHTSVALRDAIAAVALPAIEVHLTDLRKREPFRRKSLTRDACIGAVMGLGPDSYVVGLRKLVAHLGGKKK